MKKKVDKLITDAKTEIEGVESSEELEAIRVKYMGKKGKITALLKSLGELPDEERPAAGEAVNKGRKQLEETLKTSRETVRSSESAQKLRSQSVDITLPAVDHVMGHRHPINRVMEEVLDIFRGMGFSVRTGPEIEKDYYNFEALNIPKDHPARDMQDTFYFGEDTVLRTHTSPVQIRTMETEQPPLRIVSPGKVYRVDYDVTHSPMFHQVEGFIVDDRITFSDLKGVLIEFVNQFFGEGTPVRFRPSFFPFTEPSAEVDIGCVMCSGSGCRVCSDTGWLEILGSGMIHPEVFRFVNYDPEKYSGFAFGVGIERLAMLRYGIDDIRLFFENDLRFLSQFT